MLLVVPNYVADAINAAIDKAIAGRSCEDEERSFIFNRLLTHFDEHGAIPDFTLETKPPSP